MQQQSPLHAGEQLSSSSDQENYSFVEKTSCGTTQQILLHPYISIETHNFSLFHLEKLDALVEHVQKFMIDNNFDNVTTVTSVMKRRNEDDNREVVVEENNSNHHDEGNVKLDVFSTFVEEVKPINHQVNQEIYKLRESQEWTLENKTTSQSSNKGGYVPSMRIHTFEEKLENPNIAKHYFNTFGPLIFKPGEVLSDRLAYALDMDSGEEVPPYIENMKRVGYPLSYQGYEGKCFVESFDLKFDHEQVKSGGGNQQPQAEKASLCIPPDRKYIGYFGLNIAPPNEADSHRKWVYYDKSNDPSLIGRFTKHSTPSSHHGKFLSYLSLRGHFPTHRHNFDTPFGSFINDDTNENDIMMSD